MFVQVAKRSGRRGLLLFAVLSLVGITAWFAGAGPAQAAKGANYNQSADCAGVAPADRLKAFDTFNFSVDGQPVDLSKRLISPAVHPGSTVTLEFQLKPACDNTYVAINMYQMPTATFNAALASTQKLVEREGDQAFKAGQLYNIAATVPSCYYQLDVNTGWQYQPGDYTLDKQGRLLLAANGGDKACTDVAPESIPATTTSTSTTSTTAPPVVHSTSVAMTKVCKADASGYTLNFQNSGNVDEPFTVISDGKTLDTVEVPVGKSPTKTYSFADLSVAQGASIPLDIQTDGKTISSLIVANDCEKPSVAVEETCSNQAQGFQVIYANAGAVDETMTLEHNGLEQNGTTLDTVTVPANQRLAKQYTFAQLGLAPNASAGLTIQANGVTVGQPVVTNDCVKVNADVTTACNTASGSGALLTFSNTGKVDEVFDITQDGRPVAGSPVKVAASTAKTQELLALSENQVATLAITGEHSGFTTQKTVTLKCEQVLAAQIVPTTTTTVPPTTTTTTAPAKVLAEQITRPQLAATGFNFGPSAGVGGLLLSVGLGLLWFGRRLKF